MKCTTLAKKIVTAEIFMRLIELRFDIDATRGTARRELALQIEVDVA